MQESLGLVLIYSPMDGIHLRVWIHNPAVGKNKCIGIQIGKEMIFDKLNDYDKLILLGVVKSYSENIQTLHVLWL